MYKKEGTDPYKIKKIPSRGRCGGGKPLQRG